MIIVDSYVSGSRRSWCIADQDLTTETLLEALALREGSSEDVVLQCKGRILGPTDHVPESATIQATLRLPGGKGGFGSMLRAIGAQIEKTTNREACRDLSGRRLRDINEEKRLKDFISKKAEREREVQERKRQKFETLKDKPKHIFQDESYYQQREVREKNLYDSLDKAFESSNGSGPSGVKRAAVKGKEPVKAKKSRFMDDLDNSSEESSDDDESGSAVAVAREGGSSSDDSTPEQQDSDTNNIEDESKQKDEEDVIDGVEEKSSISSKNEGVVMCAS